MLCPCCRRPMVAREGVEVNDGTPFKVFDCRSAFDVVESSQWRSVAAGPLCTETVAWVPLNRLEDDDVHSA